MGSWSEQIYCNGAGASSIDAFILHLDIDALDPSPILARQLIVHGGVRIPRKAETVK